MSRPNRYRKLSDTVSMVNTELDRRTRTPASEEPPTKPWATSPSGAVILTVGGILFAILLGSLPAVAFHAIWGEPALVTQVLRGLGVTVVAVLALYQVRRHLARQSIRGLGLQRRWTAPFEGLVGVVVGAGAVVTADWIAVRTGVVTWRGSAELAQDLTLGVMLVAFLNPLLQEAIPEELWFRGHLYDTLSRSLSAAKVILATSVVFGVLHILSEPPEGIVERLLFAVMATGYGLLLTAGRVVTAALWLPIGVHAGHNAFMHRLVDIDDGSYGLLLLIRAAVMAGIAVAVLMVWRLRSRPDATGAPEVQVDPAPATGAARGSAARPGQQSHARTGGGQSLSDRARRPLLMRGRRVRLGLGTLLAAGLVATAAVLLWRGPERPEQPEGTDEPSATVDPERGADSVRALSAAPIAARIRTHAAWTGEEMLVWSGAVPRETGTGDMVGNEPFNVLEDGAAYDPAQDAWRRLPTAPIDGRAGAAAVWTGDRLLVWGGFSSRGEALDDGATYLPEEDTWVELSPAPVDGRGDATVAWTGQEVLIVGGAERPGRPGRVSGIQRDGAAYDPGEDRWRTLPPIPDGVWPLRDRGVGPIRDRFAGTWTGDALLLWGRDMALYDPEADGWERIRTPPATVWFGGRVQAVHAGDRVAILGLQLRDEPDTFGITYHPGTQTVGGVPALAHEAMTAPRQVASVDEHGVVVMSDASTAAVWRPGDTAWRLLPTAAPGGAEAAIAWTGDELLIWGGSERTEAGTGGVAWAP